MTARTQKRIVRSLIVGWCAAALMLNMAGPALAAPQGAQVQHGDVDIHQAGDTTTITASHNAVIDYQSFDIAAHQTVQFVQPGASARVLNRVLDGNATSIDGRLLANGQVYLVNPAGIYFGDQAIVNVGGIVAAAGTLTNEQFLGGLDQFTDVNGAVVNGGSIEGRRVTLIGRRVANHGSIVAPEGMVTMIAGETVYLSQTRGGLMVEVEGGDADAGQPAVENSGTIDAPGGRVNLGAGDVYTLAARHSGVTRADAVAIEAPVGRVEVDGTIDASNPGGPGGDVTLIAGQLALYQTGVIDVSGAIGGFVETSANFSLSLEGVINRLGSTGEHGTLLIDPKNIIVQAGGGGTVDQLFEDDPTLTVTVDPATIVAALNGGDVILQANNDITVNDAIDATGNALDGGLILQAGRSILINADVLLRGWFGADANVNLDLPIVDAQRDPGVAELTMAPGTLIDTSAGGTAGHDIDLALGGGYGLTHHDAGDITIERLYSGIGGDIFIEHGGRTDGGNVIINDATDIPSTLGNVVAHGVGFIEVELSDSEGLNPTGGIVINGQVIAQDGGIEIDPPSTITLNFGAALGITGDGSISLEAGSIVMADTSTLSTLGGDIDIVALDGDVVLSQLNIFGNAFGEGVMVYAPRGAILDAGDADVLAVGSADINASDGGLFYDVPVHLIARDGVGSSTGNGAIEVQAPEVFALTDNADQHLALGLDTTRIDLLAGGGAVVLWSTGDVSDDDGLYDIIADTVDLSGIGGAFGNASGLTLTDGNTNPMDVKVANVGGSTFVGIDGTDYLVNPGSPGYQGVSYLVNAPPLDIVFNGATPSSGDFEISTTGEITLAAGSPYMPSSFGDAHLRADGDVTINDMLDTTSSFGHIELYSRGKLWLGADVLSGDEIGMWAMGGIEFTGAHTVSALNNGVYMQARSPFAATPPSIVMVDGSRIVTGPHRVEVDVEGDLVVGSIESAYDAGAEPWDEGVRIHAGGAIIDGGDTDVDFVVPDAELEAWVHAGIGTSDAVETQVAGLSVGTAESGDVNIAQSGDVYVDDLDNDGPGNVYLDVAGAILEADASANGGMVQIVADDQIEMGDTVIAFASEVLLHAGRDGTGDLTFGPYEPAGYRAGIVADVVTLRAGDGPGGGTTAKLDTASFLPFFTNQTLDGNPTSFTVRQDAPLDNESDGPSTESFFGQTIDGIAFTWQVDDGNLRIFDADGSEQPMATLVASTGDVILAGLLNPESAHVTAGNDVLVNGDLTTTGASDAANFEAGGAFTMAAGTTLDAGASAIDIIADGDVTVSQLVTTSSDAMAIFIESFNGGLADADLSIGADLVAANGGVVLSTSTGIGADGQPLQTQTNRVGFYNTTSGDVVINNAHGGAELAIGTAELLDQGNASPGGQTIITNASPINIDGDINVAGDTFIVAIGDPSTPGDDMRFTNGGFVNLFASSPYTLSLSAGDNISIENGDISTGGGADHTVVLQADTEGDMVTDGTGGMVYQGAGNNLTTIQASLLFVTAPGGIGDPISAVGGKPRLFTNVDSVIADSGPSPQWWREDNGWTQAQLTSTGSDINVNLLAGDLLDSDPAVDLVGDDVVVNAAGAIGSPANPIQVLETSPVLGDFTSGIGQVHVDFGSTDVTINTPVDLVGDGNAYTAATSGSIFVNAPVQTGGSNAMVQLDAGGDIEVNDTLTTLGDDSIIDLDALGRIDLNAALSTSGANASIDVNAGTDLAFTDAVSTAGAGSAIALVAGTSVAGASGSSVDSADGVTITAPVVQVDSVVAGADVMIMADDLTLLGTIDAGGTTVTLEPITPGQPIDIDGGNNDLLASELEAVTADLLRIGAATSGDVTLFGSLTLTQVAALHIRSGGAISANSGAIAVAQLALSAAGQISAETAVDTLAVFSDTAGITITNNGDMTVGTVDGNSGLIAAGPIDLSVASDLVISQPVIAGGGSQTITLEATESIIATAALSGSVASFTVGDGHDIIASNPANTLGDVGFAASSGMVNNITIANTLAMDLGGSTIGGTLDATGPQVNLIGDYTSLNGDMLFSALVVVTGGDRIVSGENITFNLAINSDAQATPRGLTLNTQDGGTTTFNGPIGAGANGINDLGGGDDRPLANLTTNADGIVLFNTPVIVLNGNSAEFNDQSQVASDLDITETGGGDIVFAGPLDATPGSSPDVAINNTSGNVAFEQNVGGSAPLGSLTTTGGGQTQATGAIVTTGDQTYNNTFAPQGDVTTQAGGEIAFSGGTDTGGGTVNVIENDPALGGSVTEVASIAELLPGADDRREPAEQVGQTSDLARTLEAAGITVPPAMRGQGAPRQFQAAMDAFLLDQDLAADFDAGAFIRYLAANPEHRPVLDVLLAMRDVLASIDEANLPDARKAELRQAVLRQMRPVGMTADELDAVLQALPQPGAIALAS